MHKIEPEYMHYFTLEFTGFGLSESTLAKPFWKFPGREFAIFLHIITAGVIYYFIKKNKPVLGLGIAILFHRV